MVGRCRAVEPALHRVMLAATLENLRLARSVLAHRFLQRSRDATALMHSFMPMPATLPTPQQPIDLRHSERAHRAAAGHVLCGSLLSTAAPGLTVDPRGGPR
jgi:hypothetical protein